MGGTVLALSLCPGNPGEAIALRFQEDCTGAVAQAGIVG